MLAGGGRQGRKVSFNRPYWADNGRIDKTAGLFFEWEYNMVRWLERKGYDVTYASDVDTHKASDLTNGIFAPGRHKALISVGHDEYWSWKMRNNVEQARNRGNNPLNLGFFSANSIYWQIRFENSQLTNMPASERENHIIVGYKESARSVTAPLSADPLFNDTDPTNNYLITTRWRDNRKNNCPTNDLYCADNGGCPANNLNCHCPAFSPENLAPNFACTRPSEDELIGTQYSLPFNVTVASNSPSDPDDTGGVCVGQDPCPAIGDIKIQSLSIPNWLSIGMVKNLGVYTMESLIGTEADRVFTNHSYQTPSYLNRNLQTIGSSPVYNNVGGTLLQTPYNSNLTLMTLDNPANPNNSMNPVRVFSAGTIQFSWGLNDYSPLYLDGTRFHPALANSNAQAFTQNLLGCLVSNVCQ